MTQPPRTNEQEIFLDEELEDRDYANRLLPRSAYRSPAVRSYTLWIIFLCVAVAVLDMLLWYVMERWLRLEAYLWVGDVRLIMGPLQFWGHFSEYFAIDRLQIWRFVTFQFLHGNLHHLVFNMLALYFFGPLVEAYLRGAAVPAFITCCAAWAGRCFTSCC